MNYVFITILLNFIAFLVEFYFDYRQSKKLQEEGVLTEKLAEYVDEKAFEDMQTYSLLRLSFSRLESTYGFINEVVTMLCGILVWTNHLADNTCLIVLGLGPEHKVVRGIMFLFFVSLFGAIMKAPFEIYRIYVIDSKFFKSSQASKQLANWVSDQIIMFILTLIVGGPLLALILKLISIAEPVHWIYLWLGSVMCAVVVCELHPQYLAPIFNRVTELPRGDLYNQIKELCKKLNFPVKKIVYIDGSKRSQNANAFVMGVGRNKQIVLYDSLLEQLTNDEVLAIVAHEMGHYIYNHSTKIILIQCFSMGLYLLLLSQCVYNLHFYKSFGFDEVNPAVGLCLFAYLYQPFGNFTNVISNVVQRHYEYVCDQFAIMQGHDMENALIKMHVGNVYNIVADKHYSRYYHSHPSLMERLEKIEELYEKLWAQQGIERKLSSDCLQEMNDSQTDDEEELQEEALFECDDDDQQAKKDD